MGKDMDAGFPGKTAIVDGCAPDEKSYDGLAARTKEHNYDPV
jgi:hypothetical protein